MLHEWLQNEPNEKWLSLWRCCGNFHHSIVKKALNQCLRTRKFG
ncbi:hypothetical protein HVPorG_04923 [Roseomonas mucosa]|nr:hypothetical protein HVPorG_04923 [Roseomonas mucosa]